MSASGLKVGELARRTGVSVRSLHHYHELGLLVPSCHSPGETRIYSAADVERLQRIKSLQALGLSLAEVQEQLERPGVSTLEREPVKAALNPAAQARPAEARTTLPPRSRSARSRGSPPAPRRSAMSSLGRGQFPLPVAWW